MKLRRATKFLALTMWLAVPLAAQERGIQPTDYYSMTDVGDVEVSPTGEYVAFTATTMLESENDRRRTVWLQALRNREPQGEPVRITDPTRNATVIGWSPDGRTLAINSRRGEESIWFLDVGRPGEAYTIQGVRGTPIWSPDGQWIAYVGPSRNHPNDNGPRRGWISPDAITNTLNAERFDGRVITHLRYKSDGTHPLLPHPSANAKRQVFVVPAAGGEAVQVTDLPYSVSGVTWSPDSRHLVFSGDEQEDVELSPEQTVKLYAVAREGGQVRTLTPGAGSHRSPAFSRDGRRLVFLHTAERFAPTRVMVADLASDLSIQGAPRSLTATWDYQPGSPAFTPDGRSVRFESATYGNRHLFEVAVNGGQVRQVTTGDRQLASISTSRDGSVMAYTATDAVRPAEVFVSAANGDRERRVSSFNDGWLAQVRLQPAERITWRVADGTEIEGWVIRPVDFDPNRRYPLVLKAHGGPASMYGNTFFQTFHMLSANGMFVFYPNPRGSSGYGHAFMQGETTRGWGLIDEEDFLTGLDAVFAAHPQIDRTRVGVSGGSYGGYVTNWLTARHPERFAAAVTSRSITSLENLYGTSDSQGWELGAPYFEARDQYRAASPISYVENVRAPTLIIHSEYDHRTPMQDAEMWFTSLRKNGVPVEFVRYPRSSHALSRTGEPWLLVDRLERIRTWFVHWLVDQPVHTVEAR